MYKLGLHMKFCFKWLSGHMKMVNRWTETDIGIILAHLSFNSINTDDTKGVWWYGRIASDSESRSPGLDPHWRHCAVSLSKTH